MTDWTHKFEIQCFALACFALALGLAFIPGALAQTRVPHLVVRQTAAQSLALMKPTDPGFDNTVEAYFPGLTEEAGYQQAIRPFLVVVENNAGLRAVAYAITWTARYSPGWVRPLRAIFINRQLMYPPATTYISPRGVRLVSPLFNVTPQQYQANRYFAQRFPAASFPPSEKLTSVDVSVDGVVYNDGSFIGSDTTKVLQRYVMARFAIRDEALAALNLINTSARQPLTGVQLSQMLSQQIQWQLRAHESNLLAEYVRARGRSAQDLQRILRNRGPAGLAALLREFVDNWGEGSSASMFGRFYSKLSDSDPRVFGTSQ